VACRAPRHYPRGSWGPAEIGALIAPHQWRLPFECKWRGGIERVIFVRVWLPLAIAVAGVVLILTGDDAATGAGIVLIGISVLVVVLNLMLRLSLSSERDREREEANRDFFSRTGRWPDER
jgi:hypothetical protein